MQQRSLRNQLVALFKAIGRWLAVSTGAVSALLLAGTFTVVLLGVVFRYVIQAPLQWSEELARFLMLWTGFLGMNVAMYHRAHLAIDSIITQFPPRVIKVLGYVGDILIAYFLIILMMKGYSMTTRTMMQASSMEFSMFWIYMAVPLGAFLTLVQHVFQIACKLLDPSSPQKAFTNL